MITIKNVKDIHGKTQDITLASQEDEIIDGEGLTVLPALIDTHVHFRTPGGEYKEDWVSGSHAAIAGGVTTVFDMPNNVPACITHDRLLSKKRLIEQQLQRAEIPLRFGLYFGADKRYLDEIPKAKHDSIGIKVFMGSSTGDLLVDDDETLEAIFRIAGETGQIVSVHAEDECTIQNNKELNQGHACDHSKIRSPEAAVKAVTHAIALAEKHGTRLCILHMSTKEELQLVREAKAKGLPVYAEVTPHHLFLNETDYAEWDTLVQMNPPLRRIEDNQALWEGLRDGTIDFIGTDHAPHTLEEKRLPYGKAPSGVPSIELSLPLMLDAYHRGWITLEKIVELMRTNPERIFGLEPHDDIVLVDLQLEKEVTDYQLKTKCRWSPYRGRYLKGWPVMTIASGQIFNFRRNHCLQPQE